MLADDDDDDDGDIAVYVRLSVYVYSLYIYTYIHTYKRTKETYVAVGSLGSSVVFLFLLCLYSVRQRHCC